MSLFVAEIALLVGSRPILSSVSHTLDSMRGIGSVLRPRCSSEEVLVREDPKAIVIFVKLKSCMWCIVEVIAGLS